MSIDIFWAGDDCTVIEMERSVVRLECHIPHVSDSIRVFKTVWIFRSNFLIVGTEAECHFAALFGNGHISISINMLAARPKFHSIRFVATLQIYGNPSLTDNSSLFYVLLVKLTYGYSFRFSFIIRFPIINQNLTLCQRLLVFIKCHSRSIAYPQHTCHRACGETGQDGACNPLILSLHYPHLLWHFHVNRCANLYRYTLRHYIKKSPLKIKT